jgi:hypothetical protein
VSYPQARAPGRHVPENRSWALAFGAPTIAVTVPTFSAVTSRKFDGSTRGWRGGGTDFFFVAGKAESRHRRARTLKAQHRADNPLSVAAY